MKTFAAFVLVSLCAASAQADTPKPVAAMANAVTAVKAGSKATVARCNTAGDALGSLQIDVVGSVVYMLEMGMDGNTTRTKLEPSGTNITAAIAALRTGTPVNFWYRGPKATEFGGAVMNAGFLSFGNKIRNGTRAAILARRDIVYFVTCTR